MDYNDISSKLKARNLQDTFPLIRRKVAETGEWDLTEEVENLWNTYHQMLRFMLQGVNDPQSEQIRADICRQLEKIVARIERIERLQTNLTDKYTYAWKNLKNTLSFTSIADSIENVSLQIAEVKADPLLRPSVRNHNLEHLEEEHEMVLLNLFNWTWVSDIWQNSDKDQANRIIFSDHITTDDKAVFISAVTLSLFEFVDTSKLLFLLDCYLVESNLVSQRALVGFIMVFWLNFQKVRDCKELRERLRIYSDDPAFVRDFYSAMMQIQMSCTTDSVSNKMRNDIMPALMRGAMSNKPSKNNINIDELTKNGENPEWMNDEKMNKKMHEMAEMQLDGADIYYSSFANLKGYAFFGQMPHWFYPFSTNYLHSPQLHNLLNGQSGKILRLLLNNSPFCNSDKYSLCYTFQSLGDLGGAAIEEQISRQIPEGMSIDELAESNENHQPSKSAIRRYYIFDLYRFYYSYPYRMQFTNPFPLLKESPITPLGNPWLRRMLTNDKETLAQYADFLMCKEFYQTALDIFVTLADNEFDHSLASVWQKLGFCYQKLGNAADAIRAYGIANSIKPNSKWTLSHLASLLYSTENYTDAANCYMELLAISPDNQRYLLNAALSLISSDRYEEALPLLHKLLYIDEQSTDAKHLLSWCFIVCGQKDKAMKHILDLITENADDAEAQQFFALVMLADGNRQEAYMKMRDTLNEQSFKRLSQRLNTLVAHSIIEKNTATLFADALALNID
ncbi:MAG: tetratricopeptide repeat protein [Prevotellaceae bacterium]|nr:tetratricopeptide repeat protein [Prevotellaceae bacterium]